MAEMRARRGRIQDWIVACADCCSIASGCAWLSATMTNELRVRFTEAGASGVSVRRMIKTGGEDRSGAKLAKHELYRLVKDTRIEVIVRVSAAVVLQLDEGGEVLGWADGIRGVRLLWRRSIGHWWFLMSFFSVRGPVAMPVFGGGLVRLSCKRWIEV